MAKKILKVIVKTLIFVGCVWFTACRPLTGGLISMCVLIKMSRRY